MAKNNSLIYFIFRLGSCWAWPSKPSRFGQDLCGSASRKAHLDSLKEPRASKFS